MTVLFNHACDTNFSTATLFAWFDKVPRGGRLPNVLTPAEIKSLLESLALREKTLVLLAASTGLRQSELFALKWGDIDFAHGTMNVTRAIAYGVVGKCKTEASQKPVPVHPILADPLTHLETNLLLRQARGLGFRLLPTSRAKAPMGPSNTAEARETSRRKDRHPEENRMAHVPPHLFHSFAKCRC